MLLIHFVKPRDTTRRHVQALQAAKAVRRSTHALKDTELRSALRIVNFVRKFHPDLAAVIIAPVVKLTKEDAVKESVNRWSPEHDRVVTRVKPSHTEPPVWHFPVFFQTICHSCR